MFWPLNTTLSSVLDSCPFRALERRPWSHSGSFCSTFWDFCFKSTKRSMASQKNMVLSGQFFASEPSTVVGARASLRKCLRSCGWECVMVFFLSVDFGYGCSDTDSRAAERETFFVFLLLQDLFLLIYLVEVVLELWSFGCQVIYQSNFHLHLGMVFLCKHGFSSGHLCRWGKPIYIIY